ASSLLTPVAVAVTTTVCRVWVFSCLLRWFRSGVVVCAVGLPAACPLAALASAPLLDAQAAGDRTAMMALVNANLTNLWCFFMTHLQRWEIFCAAFARPFDQHLSFCTKRNPRTKACAKPPDLLSMYRASQDALRASFQSRSDEHPRGRPRRPRAQLRKPDAWRGSLPVGLQNFGEYAHQRRSAATTCT